MSMTVHAPGVRTWKQASAWIACLAIVLLAAGCRPRIADSDDDGVIKARELNAILGTRDEPLILDVRSQKEWDNGHIPGAIHIPVRQLSRRIGEIPRNGDRSLVVYCALGPRASHAKKILEENNLGPVLLLDGHMRVWARSGYPVSRNGR
jgi:rhodanese-related sulfurtransferase